MKIASSVTRDKYPLSPKKIIKKSLGNFIGGLILLIIMVPIGIYVNSIAQDTFTHVLGTTIILIASVIVILIVALSYAYQRWYYAVYFYDLTDNYVVIRKNPITPREITIPYERIQDVYVDQDLLDRLFGLYDVHISSATASSGMEAHIDGVEKAAADGLRALMLATVSKKLGHALETSPNRPQ